MFAVVGWRRRSMPGGLQGALTTAAAGIWALFYAFELGAPGLDGKVIWAKIQYVGIVLLPVAWLLFALSYTGVARKLRRPWLVLLSIIPVTTVLLAGSNELHGLIWSEVALNDSSSFLDLALEHGPWFWVIWGYSHGLIALGSALLIWGVWRYPGLFRIQTSLVILAAVAPWVGNLLYVAHVLPVAGLDLTPFAFTFSGLVLTLNMSRFRLFSVQPALLPTARDQLLMEMPDAVVVVDAHGRVATANPAASLMLGLQASSFVGKPASEALGGRIASLAGSSAAEVEKRFEITVGEEVPQRSYDVVASPIARRHSRNGAGMGRLLVFRDISERKLAEEALQQSEERFRSLSSMATEGVMIHDGGVILDANRAFAELAGYRSVDELVGKGGVEAVPFTAGSRERVRANMHAESDETYEVELVRPDGSIRWAETSGRAVTYRGRQARLVLMRDVTGRKLGEEALRRSEEQLCQSQKMESVGRLAGGIAHDFNNIAGVIRGHVELAMKQLDPDEPVYADLLEIREAAERSAGITQQLLGFARKQVVAPRRLDVNTSVEAMLNMLRRLLGDQVELTWIPGSGAGMVEMDPSQLDQILMNLCVNARDATEVAGVMTIETAAAYLDESFCAAHEGCTPGDYVRLRVRDTGCGMEPETLEHLFEPFFTTKKTGKGTGMGMATVYGIVKQNGGYIAVTSRPGQGTTVDVFLPMSPAGAGEDGRVSTTKAVAGGSEVLLIVEDEPQLLRLTARVLAGLGYRVLSAQTPAEALRMAQQPGEIDLIVTDVRMDGMSGPELVERLLILQRSAKTLYMSGYAIDAISNRGRLEKGVRLIQKPFTSGELAETVRSMLDEG